jgi:TolB-like protein/DNA-binding winged helix-turn-helix (wHTH) protein/Tfp pilus assembly protein PilF
MLAQRRYRFGEFTLDMKRGALFRGADEVRLRPKSFGVLLALVERPGELVTKDELLEQVWGRTVVTEGAVTQCLIDVRRAIGDDAQEIIRTVPRRGYLLTLPVTTADDERRDDPGPADLAAAVEAEPAPHQTAAPAPVSEPEPAPAPLAEQPSPPASSRPGRWLALAAVLAVVGMLAWWGASSLLQPESQATVATPDSTRPASATRKSIAVLPFANLTGQPDGEYLADGIADEVVHLLAQGEGFRVIARTSSFAFKGQPASIEEIARKLHVDYVVEGSLRRAGNSLRVNVQLIDAGNSSNVWSKAYERDLRDLVAVQLDIAQHVASALQTSLAGGLPADAHVPEPLAYDAFLRARFFFQRRGDGDLDRSEQAYQEALRLDPRMARAWAGLAGVYTVQIREPGADIDRLLEKQGEAVEMAIALEPQLAEVRVRAAWHYFDVGDLERANEQLAMARELSPNEPMVLWADAGDLMAEGRFDAAIDIVRVILVSDPASNVTRGNLASMLIAAGRFDEARAEFRNLLAIQQRPDPEIAVDLARMDLLEGRNEAALQAAASWPQGPDRDFVQAMAGRALRQEEAARAAEARLRQGSDPRNAVRLAEVLAHRGESDEAFRWLNLAFDRMGPRPWLANQWMALDYSPFLLGLRNDSRWNPTVQRAIPRARTATAEATSSR